MIKNVILGEEIVVTTKNRVGLMAEISIMLANKGINIEAVSGYEVGKTAKLRMVTNANLAIIHELRKKRLSVKENEVILVDLENKPGALKIVATELKKKKLDINYLYVTSASDGSSSKMVIQTNNNELAMAVLTKLIPS